MATGESIDLFVGRKPVVSGSFSNWQKKKMNVGLVVIEVSE
jgi:hypothetical protein